jgi:hypothetical protein
VVLGFSWLATKVMNKRKKQDIRLILVKVEILGFGDNQLLKTDLDPIILCWLQPNRPS